MADDTLDPKFRRVGRLSVLAVFAVVAGYILVSCITSVLLALYGKPPHMHGGALQTEDRSYCVRTLVALRDELELEVTNVAQPPKPRVDAGARWAAWDATFHQRFDEARLRCAQDDELSSAYERLAAMYDNYAGAAGKILATRTEIAPQLANVVELLDANR
jgi:hypothetical protein